MTVPKRTVFVPFLAPIASPSRREVVAGWSAAQAGEIVGLSPRTVTYWRETDLVAGKVIAPEHGVDEPGEVYGLGDLIGLRLVEHALAYGLDVRVIRTCAGEIGGLIDGDTLMDWRQVAVKGWWLLMPARWEVVEFILEDVRTAAEGVITVMPDEEKLLEDTTASGDHFRVDDADDPLGVYWPLSLMAAEVVKRADDWCRRTRLKTEDRSLWM